MKESVKVCQDCRYQKNHPSRCSQLGIFIPRKGPVTILSGKTRADKCVHFTAK